MSSTQWTHTHTALETIISLVNSTQEVATAGLERAKTATASNEFLLYSKE